MRFELLAAALAAFAVAGAGAADHGPGGVADIVIAGFQYAQTGGPVAPGQVVTVLNADIVPHTVTSGLPLMHNGQFNTGTIGGVLGQGSFVAPSAPGVYPYYCAIHIAMVGALVVE